MNALTDMHILHGQPRSSAGTSLSHHVTSATLLFIGCPSTLTHCVKRKRRVSVCIFHALDKQLCPVGVIAAELEAPGGHCLLLTCRCERTVETETAQ